MEVRGKGVFLDVYFFYFLLSRRSSPAATAVLMWMVVDKVQGSPDWRNQWLKDGFWHILFFVILVSISVLWRPTNNNARWAFQLLQSSFLSLRGHLTPGSRILLWRPLTKARMS
jgi:hypothetical protein